MALLKEKERVEKEEVRMKAKVEKEQRKERNRFEEERESKGKGEASERPTIADQVRRLSRGSSESSKDSSDEEPPVVSRAAEEDAVLSPGSPSKGHSKVKSWLAGRFRRPSKAAKDRNGSDTQKPGFVGGAGLAATSSATLGEGKGKSEIVRDVAVGGRPTTHQMVTKPQPVVPGSPVSDIRGPVSNDNASTSSMSEREEDVPSRKEKQHRGRLGFKDRLLGRTVTKSPNDTENEEFEEAQDTFDDEKLAAPPKLTAVIVTPKASASPVRDSKFSENL